MSDEMVYVIFKTEQVNERTKLPYYVAHRCQYPASVRAKLTQSCREYVGFSSSFQRCQKLIGRKGHVVSSWGSRRWFFWTFAVVMRHLGEPHARVEVSVH